jgi:hypothetical protein
LSNYVLSIDAQASFCPQNRFLSAAGAALE